MRRFQPALLGGLFIGVVSSLPIIGSFNVCCCLWVVVGGLLTVYLQRQSGDPRSYETAEAVLGGLMAGAIGALICILWAVVFSSTMSSDMLAELESALDRTGQVPPEIRNRVLSLFASGMYVFVMAAVTLPMFAIFSMLGALLGTAFWRKPKPPVPPPPPSFPTTTIES